MLFTFPYVHSSYASLAVVRPRLESNLRPCSTRNFNKPLVQDASCSFVVINAINNRHCQPMMPTRWGALLGNILVTGTSHRSASAASIAGRAVPPAAGADVFGHLGPPPGLAWGAASAADTKRSRCSLWSLCLLTPQLTQHNNIRASKKKGEHWGARRRRRVGSENAKASSEEARGERTRGHTTREI